MILFVFDILNMIEISCIGQHSAAYFYLVLLPQDQRPPGSNHVLQVLNELYFDRDLEVCPMKGFRTPI